MKNGERNKKIMTTDNQTEANETLDSIEKNGTVTPESKSGVQCLTIIGQIEGHYLLGDNAKTTKYEHIIPLLCQIEESKDVGGLLILLNTVGGDVEAGLAIAEMIAGMKKPTVSIVLGGGHSIGVPLAVASKKSYIAPSASMTLHPVRVNGVVIGAEQSFDYLYGTQERITNFVTRHSKISREQYIQLISQTGKLANDIGTILTGEEAVEWGLIDCVGTLSDALKFLHGGSL